MILLIQSSTDDVMHSVVNDNILLWLTCA